MNPKSYISKSLQVALSTTALAFYGQAAFVTDAHAQAAIFEVVHPDVEQGHVNIEVLSGVGLGSVENGEERSVHEFAIGYGVTDNWKIIAGVEVANPVGDDPVVEAFEFGSLLILHGGGHHDDEPQDSNGEHSDFTLGFYTGLEVPKEGGISEGGIEFGPVIETELGAAEFVGNLFVDVPFSDGEDAGLAYASQLVFRSTTVLE